MLKFCSFIITFLLIFYQCFGDDGYDVDNPWCINQRCQDSDCNPKTSCIHCCGKDPYSSSNRTCLDYGDKCSKQKWWIYVLGFVALLGLISCCLCCIYFMRKCCCNCDGCEDDCCNCFGDQCCFLENCCSCEDACCG